MSYLNPPSPPRLSSFWVHSSLKASLRKIDISGSLGSIHLSTNDALAPWMSFLKIRMGIKSQRISHSPMCLMAEAESWASFLSEQVKSTWGFGAKQGQWDQSQVPWLDLYGLFFSSNLHPTLSVLVWTPTIWKSVPVEGEAKYRLNEGAKSRATVKVTPGTTFLEGNWLILSRNLIVCAPYPSNLDVRNLF